ncbi:solute carrier family 2, facilitated glucose transporter member 11-like [Coregonus clupeaformis]|uniref:solute carrier family 2, facilitated glucose transporter member 11-like n=1 Tax=Coregonus clupeaformis TaxID=59861 RepID=UPI001BE11CF8|nr:solute carrier family 2, facilitated glucose transporter member 11-like [Coregonus clupeaformis]
MLIVVGVNEKGNYLNVMLMVTSCATGGILQYGYNLVIMNAPTIFIQNFVNETFRERWDVQLEDYQVTLVWTCIVSIYSLGGLAGALIAGPMSITFGRKKTMLLNNIFLMLSSLLALTSRAAKSFEMIIISRVLVGINAGISMNVQPMYFGESAPKHLRGAASLLSAIFTSFGVVLGQVVGTGCGTGCGPQVGNRQHNDEQKEACINALRRLRGCEVQRSELDEILHEQAEAKGLRPSRPWELLADRNVRWQVISIITISSAMQLCGNDSIYFYAYYVFKEAGISPDMIQYITLHTGVCEFTACIICSELGEFCFIPFTAVCFLSALYVGLVLPETKGKTLSAIASEFHKLNYRGQDKQGLPAPQGEVCHSTAL